MYSTTLSEEVPCNHAKNKPIFRRTDIPTLRSELARAVDSISPIMKDITIRMSPVKKWNKRTKFCKQKINFSI